ncbi:MAG: hypothetical protein PHI29_13160 [Gallionella sp.]|jgi:hypothetical protein|nr:hypothetical protein [Gallionella sp.]
MTNLKRIGFLPDNSGVYPHVFSSAAMLIDEDRPENKTVALVIFSSGGNIIYKHHPDYKDEELMVAAEFFVGETLRAHRWKVFNVTVEQAGGRM